MPSRRHLLACARSACATVVALAALGAATMVAAGSSSPTDASTDAPGRAIAAPAAIDEPPSVAAAVRSEVQVQLAPPAPPPTPPPPPAPTGIWGLPFAPDGLEPCDEMMFYARQFGLPDWFRTVGFRESTCRNRDDVRTFCCHGYFQLYASMHLRDHRMGPRYEACGISSHHDLNSDTPIEKQKQACAAKAVLDVSGRSAWSATAP